jgi:hypothetical protein
VAFASYCSRSCRLAASLCLFLLGLLALGVTPAAGAVGLGFTPQTRLGFTSGDQWEPAIAADGYGHVYVLYPQYGHVPGCAACPLPTMILVVSDDNGATWEAPREIAPPGSGQYDPQIVVDPADHRTVYGAWLTNRKNDAIVAKSADFGQSWSLVIADRGTADADKPVLAVRGQNVYLAFNRSRKILIASSHDGGITFNSVNMHPSLDLVRALAGGATVDPKGNLYLAWAGYSRSTASQGRVNLYVSKSPDGGKGWGTMVMDVSGAPPECSAYRCEWGYLGAQITVASDAAGTVYALWNAGKADNSPERIYFASSTTAGETWSPKTSVSDALEGVEHAFPALVAGAAGDVRIGWMDSRNAPLWNTYYRSSTNGGATWSAEAKLSSFVPGYRYIEPEGFGFPFGDYFEMGIDSQSRTQAVWGEGLNFRSPGSIWYSSGR